jgi:signal peptidase I
VVDRQVAPGQLRVGDTFTFFTKMQPGVAVTHRLVGISHDSGTVQLRTKGDANGADDIGTVDLTKPVARVVYWVPWAGYLVSFLGHNQSGIVVLLLGAALLSLWARIGPGTLLHWQVNPPGGQDAPFAGKT